MPVARMRVPLPKSVSPGGRKGHFHAECEAMDQPGTGNRLAFKIDFDQTELPDILRGLDAICDAIPVVGRKPPGSA